MEMDPKAQSPVAQISLRQLFCWITWICAGLTVLLRLGHWMTDLANVAPPAVAVLFGFVAFVLLAQIIVLRTILR